MTQSNSGRKGFITGAVALTFGRRVKLSSGLIVVTGAGEEGIGHTTEGAAISAPVNVRLDNHTVVAIASGSISEMSDCYAAAGGAMSTTISGRRQGIALQIATDTQEFEMMPVGVNS